MAPFLQTNSIDQSATSYKWNCHSTSVSHRILVRKSPRQKTETIIIIQSLPNLFSDVVQFMAPYPTFHICFSSRFRGINTMDCSAIMLENVSFKWQKHNCCSADHLGGLNRNKMVCVLPKGRIQSAIIQGNTYDYYFVLPVQYSILDTLILFKTYFQCISAAGTCVIFIE